MRSSKTGHFAASLTYPGDIFSFRSCIKPFANNHFEQFDNLPEYLTDLNGKKIQEKFSNFSNVNLTIAHMEPVEEKLERFSAERKL